MLLKGQFPQGPYSTIENLCYAPGWSQSNFIIFIRESAICWMTRGREGNWLSQCFITPIVFSNTFFPKLILYFHFILLKKMILLLKKPVFLLVTIMKYVICRPGYALYKENSAKLPYLPTAPLAGEGEEAVLYVGSVQRFLLFCKQC